MRAIVYPIADRPDVEVSVDGRRYGLLRMWNRHDDGTWWAQVQSSRAEGQDRPACAAHAVWRLYHLTAPDRLGP